MTQPTNTKCKFRISLSLEQIDWILTNCAADMPELYKQLSLLKTKADLGYTKPAYDIKPLVPKAKKDLPIEIRYKMACRFLEANDPIPDELISAYQEYRYLNDLMSEEESLAYASENEF